MNSSKKRDKDGKGSSGGEASTNYIIGTADQRGRTSDTRKEEEVTAPTSTAPNRATSNQEHITSQKQKVTSTSQTPQDETPGTIVTTPTTIMKTTTEVPNMYQQNKQQQSFNRALDETRNNIRKSIDEARSQIPRYTQATNEYQEQTIQASREIADNFLESQKEIINSLQSSWLAQMDAPNRVFTSNWMSSRYFTHIYANMISNFADNIVAATRLLNNMVFANMEAYRTTIQQARDNAKEFSRIAVNAARSLEQTARDAAANAQTTGTYFPSSSGFYSNRGGYSFNQQQIPSRQNEEDSQRVLEAQNHISGQRREQTVTDLPKAAAVGQVLKDLRFPADKNRILQFMQEQSNTNPDCQKMVPLLDKIENRQYQNVSEVTKAVGLVE